jgi:hypothetical protein
MLVASTASSTEQVGRSRKGIGSLRQERMLMDIEDGALVHKDEDEKNLYLLNRYTKNLTRLNDQRYQRSGLTALSGLKPNFGACLRTVSAT